MPSHRTIHTPWPYANGPRDLPALQEAFIRQFSPGGSLYYVRDPREDAVWANLLIEAAKQMAMWWVDEETSQLVDALASDIPMDEVFDFPMPPHAHGFVVERSRDSGFMWFWESEDKAFFVTTFRRFNAEEGLGPEALQAKGLQSMLNQMSHVGPGEIELIGDFWTTWEVSTVEPGVPLQEMVSMLNHVAGQEGLDADPKAVAETRSLTSRRTVALWILASTPTISERVDVPMDRPTRRRLQRAGAAKPEIEVVKLRGSTDGDPTNVPQEGHYSVRWMVRPHLRNQAYGPGRSKRKLILVPPYVKGPDGAPMKDPTKKVFKV